MGGVRTKGFEDLKKMKVTVHSGIEINFKITFFKKINIRSLVQTLSVQLSQKRKSALSKHFLLNKQISPLEKIGAKTY